MSETAVSENMAIKEISGERFTPFSLCSKLGAKALLESASFERGRGRYSLLLLKEAFSVFHSKDGIFLKDSCGETAMEAENGDILDVVRSLSKMHRTSFVPFPLPAAGIGYLSYDYALRFDDIRAKSNPDPIGIPDAVFIFGHVFLVFDHYSDRITIVGLNYGDYGIDLKRAIRETEERINDLDFNYLVSTDKEYPACALIGGNEQQEYCDGVRRMRREIVKGNLLQGVLSRRVRVRTEIPALEAYRRLRSLNPSPYMFWLDIGEFQLFGSSPEIHVKVDNKRVTIRPLAGTRKRGKSREEDMKLELELCTDEKEKAEHLMLVDLARNDLGRVCRMKTVEVTELMEVERYSHVMHMVSQVEGELEDGRSGVDAVRATFPAGTVTGAPKIRAMEIISELEREKRGFYSGLVGYVQADGSLDTCITIRSALKKDDMLLLQAGAGIVYDSVPEKEFAETSSKLEAMGSMLGLEV
ncbi:MAG: chorismate-binding protein [Spirochaetes bacterium]|nr:chorismate-binding protein [Spirochaetota bacterium]